MYTIIQLLALKHHNIPPFINLSHLLNSLNLFFFSSILISTCIPEETMPRLKRSDKGVGRRQKKHNFVRKGGSIVQGISYMQTCQQYRAFSSNFWKRPLAKIGKKNDQLNSKIGRNLQHRT